MTTIFTDIENFKMFVGGAANVSMTIDSLAPIMHLTAKKHLTDWLGENQYNTLLTNFEAETLTANEATLLPYVQRPLALLTLFEYSDIGSLQFSEAGGLVRVETDYHKTAYKYQVNAYKDFMLHAGYDSIEEMLNFLQANKADYPDWDSEKGAKNKELLINTAKEFRNAYGKTISRYTFECLRNLIADIENFAILPLTGPELFEALRTAINADTLSAKQAQLVKLLHKSISYFTIEEALKKNWVRIEGNTIFQEEKAEAQGLKTDKTAETQPHSSALRFHDNWANRHNTFAQKFIEDNLADFPEYELFLNAQLGLEADATAADRLEKQEEIDRLANYEDTCCNQDEIDHRLGANNCTIKKKKKGVVRL